nr:MAG TPA: hypothetical protein [Bacteriophage sp.]
MAGLSIPQSEYRAHPAISKSDLFKITKSPLHYSDGWIINSTKRI